MAAPSIVPFALVVDDDAVVLTDAAAILEEAGFRTLTAMNAEEALALLRRHGGGITILFTDVEIPGRMNGFGLAHETAQRWPDIAIMVGSGRMEPGAEDLPDGATFIRKPFSAGVVHQRLQQPLPDGRKPEPLRRAQ